MDIFLVEISICEPIDLQMTIPQATSGMIANKANSPRTTKNVAHVTIMRSTVSEIVSPDTSHETVSGLSTDRGQRVSRAGRRDQPGAESGL